MYVFAQKLVNGANKTCDICTDSYVAAMLDIYLQQTHTRNTMVGKLCTNNNPGTVHKADILQNVEQQLVYTGIIMLNK